MSDPRCLSCGACCFEAVVPPFDPEEIESIPEDLASPIRAVWAHAADPSSGFWDQTGTRVCSWYNARSGECSHYDIRPRVCREFEPGGDECRSVRKRHGLDDTVELTVNGNQR